MPQYVLLLAGLMLATPTSDPVSYDQAGQRLAAARVKNWVSGYRQPGPTISGTGTLTAIDGRSAMVLTAAHLFENEVGPITVEFHDGQTSGARILAIDRKLDVAALWIYAPRGIQPVPIDERAPKWARKSRSGASVPNGSAPSWPQSPNRFPWTGMCPTRWSPPRACRTSK